MDAEPPKRKRHWFQFQFSLRTLLIFALIAALGCAWLGRKIERKRREQAIVDAIRERGGVVEYDYINGEPSGPAWLRWLLGDNLFDDVKRARIRHVDEATLGGLAEMTRLRRLDLNNTNMTDDGLAHLKGLTQLQWLDLDNTQVTDGGLVNLKGLIQLQNLFLAKTKVTDDGLVNLKALNELQRLFLFNTKVTGAGVADLNKALPNCKIMRGSLRSSASR